MHRTYVYTVVVTSADALGLLHLNSTVGKYSDAHQPCLATFQSSCISLGFASLLGCWVATFLACSTIISNASIDTWQNVWP